MLERCEQSERAAEQLNDKTNGCIDNPSNGLSYLGGIGDVLNESRIVAFYEICLLASTVIFMNNEKA